MAVSLVDGEEMGLLRDIEKLIRFSPPRQDMRRNPNAPISDGAPAKRNRNHRGGHGRPQQAHGHGNGNGHGAGGREQRNGRPQQSFGKRRGGGRQGERQAGFAAS
jgi:ATP-dependent RNA helicase RhlE